MIQAHSIASVIELADDPPLDYEQRTADGGQSLVLYIVRVPGSKDVFLTTIKPPAKVVRAEDVQNCLYYIHADSDNDEKLLQEEKERISLESEERSWNTAELNSDVPQVRRKPLPARPALPASGVPDPPPKCFPHYQPPSCTSENAGPKTLSLDAAKSSPHLSKNQIMGPRPLSSNQRSSAVYRHKQQDLDCWYHSNRDIQPSLTSTPATVSDPLDTYDKFHNVPNRVSLRNPLTLVRRYGGEQSNVCRVDRDGSLQVFSKTEKKNGLLRPLHQQEPKSSKGTSEGMQKYFSTTLRTGRGIPSGPHLNEITNTHRRSRATFQAKQTGSYIFSTPWGNTCQFFTGIGGRSLRCKHSETTGFEPASISELRPDLPSTNPLKSPSKPSPVDKQEFRRRSYFGNQESYNREASETSRHRLSMSVADTTTHDAEEDEGTDLSLGQERAGGGFGGKQSKLGKLIIEPEGFQMLDLLVGANVAVWWKMYDKGA